MKRLILSLVVALATVTAAMATPPMVESVEARKVASGWTFAVTLRHGDTGWDDYADGWRVLAPDGTVLGTRVLAHPHVEEQPFTRTLGNVQIPDSLRDVQIQVRTSPEGWWDQTVPYQLPE